MKKHEKWMREAVEFAQQVRAYEIKNAMRRFAQNPNTLQEIELQMMGQKLRVYEEELVKEMERVACKEPR